MALLEFTSNGIYCKEGDFYIDPWRHVKKAIITHAHSDHSRYGMEAYLATPQSIPVMRLRLGEHINVEGLDYGKSVNINGVKVSFHPAGHITGSAQVRVEHNGEIWVASGDYKLAPDKALESFEPVPCHSFITECTFGLPVFKWKSNEVLYQEINDWWAENAENGFCSILAGYALGKAQRLIQNLDPTIGPIYTHGAVENVNRVLKDIIDLPTTFPAFQENNKINFRKGIIICPPSAIGTPWLRKFAPFKTAIASGWMGLRGARRRRAVDKGFILSDHADWPDLLKAIESTGAQQIITTHGYTSIFTKYLQSIGYHSWEASTEYTGESLENEITSADVPVEDNSDTVSSPSN
ncbi:MAG: hypothetical protein DDT42_02017 [candidate division WS2 bacterium]|uniref:Ligase-associated DNA damage response exonuclease n=1 Tax=Psychracetigena formicireducens TaxID=2986056 RepID=A0A9E2BIC0_PSYF1|nr:hypothetical protein [Candidatus Psychracetigena formicireducens]